MGGSNASHGGLGDAYVSSFADWSKRVDAEQDGGTAAIKPPGTTLTMEHLHAAFDLLRQQQEALAQKAFFSSFYQQQASSIIGGIGALQHGQHRSPLAQVYGYPAQAAGPVYSGTLTCSAFPAHALYKTLPPSGAFYGADFAREDPEPESTGVEVGEIIAWRVWKVDELGFLTSVIVDDHVWDPDKPFKSDEINLTLGVHAFKDRKRAVQSYGSQAGAVIGRVKLWGEVYEFEEGYHAEFAEVHSLDFHRPDFVEPLSDNNEHLRGLRERYGVAENAYAPVPAYKRLSPSARAWKWISFYFGCYAVGYWLPLGMTYLVELSNQPALALTGVAQWPGL